MSSQQVQHRAKGKTAQANPIDTSGRTIPSNYRDEARAQPQLLTNQEFDATNNQLLTAGQTIEVARQRLFETRFVASSAMQELEQERQVRQRCSDAYKELHVQYGRKVTELHEMTTKCISLHKELEESQETVSNYNSDFKEYERRVTAEKAQLEDRIRDSEGGRVETAQQMQVVLEDRNSARGRVDELEKELNKTLAREALALQKFDEQEKVREHLIQEHRVEVNMMTAREALALQRIDELQKGVDELIQEHQEAMDIAVDRMNSAEKMVDGFRKIYGTSERQEVALTSPNPPPEQSSGAGKREREVPKQQRGRPSRYRKCKAAIKAGEEDKIVVRETKWPGEIW
ncbi:hypothetical protein BGZ60DRAFT_519459 [Tricladium varicosporioides]|nr:hypothetical protein BGZ60DRAFT_519459 [Hymenoscyphus varicosporioides]